MVECVSGGGGNIANIEGMHKFACFTQVSVIIDAKLPKIERFD